MNQKLRTYLKLSFWIQLGVTLILADFVSLRIFIILLSICGFTVFILALDSIYIIVMRLLGKRTFFYEIRNEERSKLAGERMYLEGIDFILRRDNNKGITVEELDKGLEESWQKTVTGKPFMPVMPKDKLPHE